MERLLGLAPLVALLLFILYDRARMSSSKAEPISRKQMEAGFRPGASLAWKGPAGVALLALLMSGHQLTTPSLPPFTGRWAWLNAALYGALGQYGLAVFSGACAFAFAVVAYGKYRSYRREQTNLE